MRKIFFIIPLIILVLGGCSDSSGPTNEYGLYKYSHIEEESIEVYGKAGEELPESEWDESINTAKEAFDNELASFEVLKLKLMENTFEAIKGNQSEATPYIMKGDTIVGLIISGSDTLKINLALQIDNKTLEFHQYSFVVQKQGQGTEFESGSNIGGYEEISHPLMQEIQSLKSDEYIATFFRKFRYKK